MAAQSGHSVPDGFVKRTAYAGAQIVLAPIHEISLRRFDGPEETGARRLAPPENKGLVQMHVRIHRQRYGNLAGRFRLRFDRSDPLSTQSKTDGASIEQNMTELSVHGESRFRASAREPYVRPRSSGERSRFRAMRPETALRTCAGFRCGRSFL